MFNENRKNLCLLDMGGVKITTPSVAILPNLLEFGNFETSGIQRQLFCHY